MKPTSEEAQRIVNYITRFMQAAPVGFDTRTAVRALKIVIEDIRAGEHFKTHGDPLSSERKES